MEEYRIEERRTGSGGDSGYGIEYVLVTPNGEIPVVQDESGQFFANIIGSSGGDSGGLNYMGAAIDIPSILQQQSAAASKPYGTGEGQALGYAYGIKNSNGDIYKKYDENGNLTEFLDKDGKFQKASDVKPNGFVYNPVTGQLDTVYEYGGRKDIIGNSYVPGMSPYHEDQGGWLGEGGWKNMGMLALTALSAGAAAGLGGAGMAGALGANAAESAAAISALINGGSTLGNTLQIANQLVNIGTSAYDSLKNNHPEAAAVIEKLQAETK